MEIRELNVSSIYLIAFACTSLVAGLAVSVVEKSEREHTIYHTLFIGGCKSTQRSGGSGQRVLAFENGIVHYTAAGCCNVSNS